MDASYRMAEKRRATARDFAYWIGDTVYLRVNSERAPGFITGITIRQTGTVYGASFSDGEGWYYDFELTEDYVPDFGVTQEAD